MAALIRAILVAAGLAFAAGSVVASENIQLVEQKIKAGLIYNFLKYTEWPGLAPGSNVVVCLFGGDPFEGHLQPMAGRTVNQHQIEIRTISGAGEIAACSLLFLNANASGSWPSLRDALKDQDVLTVSDIDGFSADGGMIEFTRVNNRIGVKVNTAATAGANLKIQDRLLRLAGGPQAGGGP